MIDAVTQQEIDTARSAGKVIVLATGVFDVIHSEHVLFLTQAKKLGWLIVGVESDHRVRSLKGEGRPINTAALRKKNLEKTGIPDLVFILPSDFSKPEHHQALIEQVRPNHLAVSSHTAHLKKKQAILQQFGGKVSIVHQHNPAVSTTQLLKHNPR